MRKRVSNAVLTAAAGLTLAGGCSAAMVSAVSASNAEGVAPGSPTGAAASPDRAGTDSHDGTREGQGTAEAGLPGQDKKKDSEGEKGRGLPGGLSTATSFWDPETASGEPMSYRTLASPYWPLGTKVKITYNGKSTVGVVDDFGPAEWAVAQHDPPAVVDLSEKMMDRLSGSTDNVVQVKFKVLDMGDGPTYRKSGTGYDSAFGRD